MIHKYTSVNLVIAKLIRDIGADKIENDFDSIIEWISEVITRTSGYDALVYKTKEVKVESFRAELPCDLWQLIAINCEGSRLHYNNGKMKINPTKAIEQSYNYFPNVALIQREDCDGNIESQVFNYDWVRSMLPLNVPQIVQTGWYTLNGGWLNFSMEEATVELHYLAPLTDEEGYLMIPDNSNLREAIYFYVLWKMMGRGFKHKILPWNSVLELYEKYLGRALGAMRYPSQDQIHSITNSWVRLLPKLDYWKKFNK